jgi:YD repeat-containing protein
VTDPRQLKTSYGLDGLGNQKTISSPDAGAQSFTFDEAGNVKTAKDAKGQTTTYVYDVLNRVKQATFEDGSKHVYEYDTAANGKGKLAKLTESDAAGNTVMTLSMAYDALNRVQSQTRVVAGKAQATEYSYDAAGRLQSMTYPSGRKVTYSYDLSGRISGVTTAASGGTSMAVISEVQYHPFGGVKQYKYGNGQVQKLAINADGRPSGYVLGATGYKLDYDDAGQLKTISNQSSISDVNSYGWDGLSRLTTATLPSATHGYKYDGVGNRSRATTGGTTVTYSYASDKNWLTTVGSDTQTFDANGSLQTSKAGTFTHDVRGRLSKLVGAGGTTTYGVDALGLRVRKTNSSGDVLYAYDVDGNLIAETTLSGAVVKEYIYLAGRPIAVVSH